MRNKYSGICYRCGKPVPAGKGHFERKDRRWAVIHAECVFEQRAEKLAHTQTNQQISNQQE